MKFTIYNEDGQKMGKIYYFDGVKNVARLLIDQIEVLTIENVLDETSKNVYDPKFEKYVFEDQRGRSFVLNRSAVIDNLGKSPSAISNEASDIERLS